jgi:hypothetical protein
MSTSRNYHAREPRDLADFRGGTSRRNGTGSQKHNPCANVGEESNIGVVPAKSLNKAGRKDGSGSDGGKAGD